MKSPIWPPMSPGEREKKSRGEECGPLPTPVSHLQDDDDDSSVRFLSHPKPAGHAQTSTLEEPSQGAGPFDGATGAGRIFALTQQPSHFIRLLLLDGLVVQSFEEYLQHQHVVPGARERESARSLLWRGREGAAPRPPARWLGALCLPSHLPLSGIAGTRVPLPCSLRYLVPCLGGLQLGSLSFVSKRGRAHNTSRACPPSPRTTRLEHSPEPSPSADAIARSVGGLQREWHHLMGGRGRALAGALGGRTHCDAEPGTGEEWSPSQRERRPPGAYVMYCSLRLYFFARYLAEALLGILTTESSLL